MALSLNIADKHYIFLLLGKLLQEQGWLSMVYEQQLADTIARYGGYGVWMATLRGLDDSEPLKGGMLQLTDKVNAHFPWSACPQFLQLHTLKVCLPFKITGNHRKLTCE